MAGTVDLVGFATNPGIWGIPLDESDSLNLESIEVVVRPEFKQYMMDRVNTARAFAVAAPEREVTVSGDIVGTTGNLLAATFKAAIVLTNVVAYHSATGGLYADEFTYRFGRDRWKNFSAKLTSKPGIA